MPGSQVANWPMYEALRRKGYAKALAAKIANSRGKHKPRHLQVVKK